MEITQARLAEIIGAYPGDFSVLAVDGSRIRALYSAPALAGYVGMQPEEYSALTGEDMLAAVWESDRPALLAALNGAAQHAGKQDGGLALRLIHKSKGSVWLHAKYRRIGEQNGVPVFLAVFLNVSEELQACTGIFDYAIAAIYVIDRETHELLYANAPALRLWGCAEYSGCACYQLMGGPDAPCAWCPMRKMRGGVAHVDECYFPKLGKWLQANYRSIPWFGRDAVAVYALDVTDQVKRRQRLELDKETLTAIVDNIPLGIGVCSVKRGAIHAVTTNHRLAELLGQPAEQFSIVGPELTARVHPADLAGLTQAFQRCAEPDADIRCEFRLHEGARGDYRTLLLNARTIPQNDGTMAFLCFSDITSEKNAELEVHKGQQMYQAAAEAADLVVWEYTPSMRRVTMMLDNPSTRAFCEKYDIPRVPAGGPDYFTELILPSDRSAYLELYRRIDAGAGRAVCEVGLSRGGSNTLYLRLSCTAVLGGEGRAIAVYGIAQDITAERLELERHRRGYQQLLDSDADSVGLYRLNLTQNRCDSGWNKYPKVLPPEACVTVDGFVAAISRMISDRKKQREFLSVFSRESLQRLFLEGQAEAHMEFPCNVPGINGVWAEGRVHLMQNPQTGDLEAVAVCVDITTRKRNEEVIASLTDHQFDYIAILNLQAQTIELRTRREELDYGMLYQPMPYEEWRTHICTQWIAPPDREEYLRYTDLARIEAELRANAIYSCAFLRSGAGGTTRRQLQYGWLDISRGEILVVRTDTTAAYRQEQTQLHLLEQALHRAEEANRAKSEFVSRISHDIRTPISISLSMTDFALQDIADPDRLRADLEKIRSSNTFLLSLINDVLDISKIDSGRIELKPEPYAYSEYIANIANMFGTLCREKGLHFSIEQRRPFSGGVVADKIRLNQIALNLLSNAVKYTPPGADVRYISDSTVLPDGRVRFAFEVQDTGIGMSEEFQKRMFEPFSQEYDNPGRPKAVTGTGLGLSIIKHIVELMDGTLTVHSALGKGTTIRCELLLPLAESTADGASADVSEAQSSAKPFLHGRVLLAEDNPINAEIAQRILAGFGLSVDHAENGREAVRMFSDSAPGAYRMIFMDLQMPLLNGYEATEQIRALPRSDACVPIYALTADAFADAALKGRAAGMNGHITKPLDPRRLYDALTCTEPPAFGAGDACGQLPRPCGKPAAAKGDTK